MSVFTQFTGNTPSQAVWTRAFNSSTTFVPAESGWYQFLAVGAGGSGGAAAAASFYGVYTARANGGGAGGCAIKTAFVSAGASIVITIGAGGFGGTANTFSNSTASGSSGSITTVVGGGVSLTCNAGAGGTALATSGNIAPSVGGNATGGDYNFSGGGGGSLSVSLYQVGGIGGGAVGFFGTGLTSTSRGGPGTGSVGSDNRAGDGYSIAQYGFSPGSNVSIANIQPTLGAPPLIFGISHDGVGQTTAGSSINAYPSPAVGAGGAGVSAGEANNPSTGGLFGGGGGNYTYTNSGSIGGARGGTGGRGGGGGGVGAFADPGNCQSIGGTGGSGFVQIGFLGS